MPTINDSVQFLKGVGPAFAKKFEKLGILTIRDLLLCYPRKYIDYTQPYTVVSAPYDVECCVRATVLQKEPARRVKGGRVMNRVLAADDSGILALSWFNAPYAADKLEVGETYYFEGRIGGALTRRELLHPLVRTEAQVADCPFVAVYPGTDGLPASRHAGGPARAVRRQRHAAGRRHESEGEAHRAGGYRRWAGKFSRRYACRADRHRGI